MDTIKATDARKEWSATIDTVVRNKPLIINRTRDYVVMSNAKTMEFLLEIYGFSAERFIEDDGSVTLSLKEIDLDENATNEQSAKIKLAESMIDYAEDFYSDFSYWSSAPNRKNHVPYVLRILMIKDPVKIGEMITCQDGEN